MCMGGGSGGRVNPNIKGDTPVTQPVVDKPDPTVEIWNQRRRQNNMLSAVGMGEGVGNDNGPTTALKKLMGA